MKIKSLALLFTLCAALTTPAWAAPVTLESEPYRMWFYNKQQPEKLHAMGQTNRVEFGFAHYFAGMEGENVGVLWRGKIQVPDDRGVWLHYSRKFDLKINGEKVEIYGAVPQFKHLPLKKGQHTVEVRYESGWHADNAVLNFLSADQQALDPKVLTKKLNIKPNDVVVFAEVTGRAKQTDDKKPENRIQDSLIQLPKRNGEQIVVLTSSSYSELENVEVQPEKGAKIKAIIALPSVGVVSGSSAPVYRVSHDEPEHVHDWWAQDCRCDGGRVLHCSVEKEQAGYHHIKQFSQTLLGKTPDFWHRQLDGWQSDRQASRANQAAIKHLRDTQARCGGALSPTFTNQAPTKQGGEKSWLSQLGFRLPEKGFDAYYFHQDKMSKPVAKDNVSHIAMNYVYDEFHNIPSEKFAALWAGYLNVPQNTKMSMQYDLSWSQLRVFLNGKKVFEHRNREEEEEKNKGYFDLMVPKGKNRLEVEYINHWHTVGFSMNPQPKLTQSHQDKAQKLADNPDYELVYVKVGDIVNQDRTLPITLPKTNKPIVLVLESSYTIFWQIQPSASPLKAVVIQDGKGMVSGSTAPVLRVADLPTSHWHRPILYADTSDTRAIKNFEKKDFSQEKPVRVRPPLMY